MRSMERRVHTLERATPAEIANFRIFIITLPAGISRDDALVALDIEPEPDDYVVCLVSPSTDGEPRLISSPAAGDNQNACHDTNRG